MLLSICVSRETKLKNNACAYNTANNYSVKGKSMLLPLYSKEWTQYMETLLSISIAIFAGLMMSRLAKLLKLPAVTSYLIAGILIGPYFLGKLNIPGIGFASHDAVTALKVMSDVALGFIAFAIGNEFRLSQLKKTGKAAVVIAIIQALSATVLVDLALFILHLIVGEDKLPLSVVIVLGAIATATAPAATLMVVKQYKAKGELTGILLPIVALDDAVGLFVFAISFGIAKAMLHGSLSIVSILVNPLLEVVLSLLLGTVLGFIFTYLERFFKSRSKRLSLSVTFVIMAVALTMLSYKIPGSDLEISFSPLLVCMMLGTVFCNICDFSEELMDRADRWTAPLYILFFVLSGAELEFSIFSSAIVVITGIVYILSRSAGKYIGAFAGSAIMKTSPTIKKYLGITLLPQAGVALGMSLSAAEFLGAEGSIIRNITLFAVLVYELIGPTLTKLSLIKAGEIQPKAE